MVPEFAGVTPQMVLTSVVLPERGLAGAVRTDQAEHFSLMDAERDLAKGLQAAEMPRHGVKAKDLRHALLRHSLPSPKTG
jgi:hypothetical protein